MNVTIIGAGPAGLTAGIYLARKGFPVTIFDKRKDLSQTDEESYPIGINPRGLQALEIVNPNASEHIKDDIVNAWSINNSSHTEVANLSSGTVIGTTRGRVIDFLYAEASCEENIKFKLGWKLSNVESLEILRFEKDKDTFEIKVGPNDRIIDASGCWSKLRDTLSKVDETFIAETKAWRATFRNLFTKSNPQTSLNPQTHYIFNTGAGTVYAANLRDGRWVFVLFIADESPNKFLKEDIPSPKKLKEFVETNLPWAIEMFDEEEYTRFFTRKSFTGQVVKVSRLNHGENLVFLGDAAHSVLPSTGEGVNSSLEDCEVLMKALDEDFEKWFEHFDSLRREDVRALSSYAMWMVEEWHGGKKMKNKRLANIITRGIFQKLGFINPSWSEKSFGHLATKREPYSHIFKEWMKAQRYLEPLCSVIAFIPNLFVD